MPRTLAERFWSTVAVTPNESDCWEWKGFRHSKGYGCFKIEKKVYRASRISWVLDGGEIPEGHGVLHHCDNPPCCNPAHLFTGTQATNVADMVAKGRLVNLKGQLHGSAVLDDTKVIEIRRRLATGETATVLANEFGVSLSALCSIKHRKTWRHL